MGVVLPGGWWSGWGWGVVTDDTQCIIVMYHSCVWFLRWGGACVGVSCVGGLLVYAGGVFLGSRGLGRWVGGSGGAQRSPVLCGGPASVG